MSKSIAVSVVVAFLLAITTVASADDPSKGAVVSETIVATWTCQSQLGVPRTAARDPWKHHSSSYWLHELRLWQGRLHGCLDQLHARAEIWRKLNTGIAYYYRTQHLSSGPLSGQGRTIEAAGRRYGVSPYLMVATSVTESSMGLHACGFRGHNIWGLANCDGSWNVPDFWTWGVAFNFYARFLSERWPNANTAYDYSGYAACSACWGSSTSGHMRALFGETSARYPSVT